MVPGRAIIRCSSPSIFLRWGTLVEVRRSSPRRCCLSAKAIRSWPIRGACRRACRCQSRRAPEAESFEPMTRRLAKCCGKPSFRPAPPARRCPTCSKASNTSSSRSAHATIPPSWWRSVCPDDHFDQVCRGWSVAQRVEQRVDAKGVADSGEPIEVRAVLTFALECIAVVGIVRDEHQHVTLVVQDCAGVRHLAVNALGSLASTKPDADRRYLGDAVHVVQRVEERVSPRQVDHWELVRRQRLPNFRLEDVPGVLTPEVIHPEEAALDQIIAQMRGIVLIQEQSADLLHDYD